MKLPWALGLGIVEQAHDDVVDVAAVVPVALAAHRGDPRRADRAGGVVDAGEQVDEQIAGDGRAVIPVIPPAEEPDRRRTDAWGRRPGSGPSRPSPARRRSGSSIARRRASELRLYRASIACTLPMRPSAISSLTLS